MTDEAPDHPESARFWRLNSLAALKMMDLNEREAQDPEHFAAIKSAKAEFLELAAQENRVTSRHARIYGKLAQG